jgi:hypothetical protein
MVDLFPKSVSQRAITENEGETVNCPNAGLLNVPIYRLL